MEYQYYKYEKRNFYDLRRYLAIGLDAATAFVITAGIMTNNPTIIGLGSSAGLSLVFFSYDVWLEQRQIKINDITKFLESQKPFE